MKLPGLTQEGLRRIAKHLDAQEAPVEEGSFDDEILEGIARALFVDAWMYEWEMLYERYGDKEDIELPYGPGDRVDLMAPETPSEAYEAAREAYKEIEQANGINLKSFIPPEEDENYDRDLFGWYLAMEWLGHGVSWSDSHEDHELKIPYGDTSSDLAYAGDEELTELANHLDEQYGDKQWTD